MTTKRQRILSRWSSLKEERNSWIDHWRDLGENLGPRRPRFLLTERNKGTRKNQHIINNTPLRAVRTLSSGMMSGITSPARPWFRLTTPTAWAKTPAVATWLYEVEKRMAEVMAKSNLYNALPLVYTDLGVFGTSAMVVEEDEEDVIRCYVLPIGQYATASSYRLTVDTIYREYSFTTAQMVQKFGLKRCSRRIKEAWKKGRLDEWHTVLHVVEPRYLDTEDLREGEIDEMEGPGEDAGVLKAKPEATEKSDMVDANGEPDLLGLSSGPNGQDTNSEPDDGTSGLPTQPTRSTEAIYAPQEMPWASIYLDMAAADDEDGILHEGGFNEWPVLCPRWNITGEDVYGSSPGMDALGDCRALQLYEKRKAQAIDKIVNPPMKGPGSLRNQRASLLPGDITYLDNTGQGTSFEPAMVLPPQAVQILDMSIKEHESRINAAFYADLWLAITNDDRSIPATAREIVERHEEKMLQLGPTLERIQDELLDPLVERIFAIMYRRGLIPQAPREIQGQELRVEYISVMSKAQKLVGTAAVERLLSVATGIAQVNPQIVDKLDFDAMLEEYADMVGVAPQIIKDQAQVVETRKQRDAAQHKAQQVEAAPPLAQAAKNLATAKIEDDNALGRLMGSIGAAPAGGPPGGMA